MGLFDFLKKKEPKNRPIENEHEKIMLAIQMLKKGSGIKNIFSYLKAFHGLNNEQAATILEAATNLKDSPGYDSDLTAVQGKKDNIFFAVNELLGNTSHSEIIKKLWHYNNVNPEQAEIILQKAIPIYSYMQEIDSKNQSDEISSTTPKTEEEKPLSINERFAKKETTSLNDRYSKNNGEHNTLKSTIEQKSVNDMGHVDNFGGLFGYKTLQSNIKDTVINHIINNAVAANPLHENPIFKVCESDFNSLGGNSTKIKIRVIYVIRAAAGKDFVLDVFPYLQTQRIIPFKTKKINEWQEFSKMEAEIEGGGRDTFGFGFFATDYAYNKKSYLSENSINVKISAIALVINKSDTTEINGTQLSPDFATYMPNKDFSGKSYNDFIGVLMDFEKVTLTQSLHGYILTLKLINHEVEDFFIVDTFVNEENMKISELNAGMKLTGCIWLQGEIA